MSLRKQAVKEAFENNGMEVALESFGKSIRRRTGKGDQHMAEVPCLSLHRRDEPTQPMSVMHEPGICVIARGAKRVLLGDETYVYDPQHFLSKDDEAMENIARCIIRESFTRGVEAPT